MEISHSFFNQSLTNKQKSIIYQNLIVSPRYHSAIIRLFEYGIQNDLIDDLYLLIELVGKDNIMFSNHLATQLINYLKEKELLIELDNISI